MTTAAARIVWLSLKVACHEAAVLALVVIVGVLSMLAFIISVALAAFYRIAAVLHAGGKGRAAGGLPHQSAARQIARRR